jgi:hypothetical protein
MKTLCLVITLAAQLSFAETNAPTRNIVLVWDYPLNELSTNLSFYVFHSTNSADPLPTWTVLTNFPGTNLQIQFPIQPGINYFTMRASNLWGNSDFSEVAATPPLPRSDVKLKILRVE